MVPYRLWNDDVTALSMLTNLKHIELELIHMGNFDLIDKWLTAMAKRNLLQELVLDLPEKLIFASETIKSFLSFSSLERVPTF